MHTVTDESGENKFVFEEIYYYVKPYFIVDILKDKEKTPDIKVSVDVEILKEIDFVLYAKPIKKSIAWARKQKYIYYLRPKDAPIEVNFKKLNRMPANHYLEIDVANFKIRLVGTFVDDGNWKLY